MQALRRKQIKRLDEVLDKLHELALEGDVAAARVLLSVVIPPLKPAGTPQPINLGGTHDWQEIGAQLLALMVSGQISPDAAETITRTLGNYLTTVGRTDIAQQIAELKEKVTQMDEKPRYRR